MRGTYCTKLPYILLCIFVACLFFSLSLSLSLSFFFLGKNFVKQHDAKVFSKARQMSEVILTPRSPSFYLYLEAPHLQSNQSINVTSATLLVFFFAFFFLFFSFCFFLTCMYLLQQSFPLLNSFIRLFFA